MKFYLELRKVMGENDIFKLAKSLHDNYQPFMLDCQVWGLIEKVVPQQVYNDLFLSHKKTVVGHSVVNDIVMNAYFGERKIKYHLSLKYMNRLDEVSIFEFNVGASRLDFARINGSSYAYEIKTELDSLDKLEKQIEDYSKVFEYLHVVCHPEHYDKVIKRVPSYCGIITYNTVRSDLPFSFRRKRVENTAICSFAQLSSLTVKELDQILKNEDMTINTSARELKEEIILSKLPAKKINLHFKESLKKRFVKRWRFICDNVDKIQPIDIQPFYRSTADPYWVYYKNSSMV